MEADGFGDPPETVIVRRIAFPLSVHGGRRRCCVNVPHVIASLTDVALRPALLVGEQSSNGVTVWALRGSHRFVRVDLRAANASTPRGSRGSRHWQESTSNSRRRRVVK